MDVCNCPNHKICQIIHLDGFVKDEKTKYFYIKNFCEADKDGWIHCKRFQTKKILNFCPDFVLPDSTYTIDEIMDKLEK